MDKYKKVSKLISHKEYLDMPNFGSSTIKAYAKHPYAIRSNTTPAMTLGSALHSYVLEPDKFNDNYFVSEYSDKRIKAVKDELEYCSENNKTWISVKDYEMLRKMHYAVMNRSAFAKRLLSGGVAESTIEFDHGGIMCKSRPDYVTKIGESYFCSDLKKISPRGGILDVKEIESSIGTYGYHIQAAFYLIGLKQVLKTDDVYFVNIFVSEPTNGEPECVCTLMPQDSIDIGMIEIEMAISNIKKYKEPPTAELFISNKQIYDGVINKGMPSIGVPGWYKV